MNLDDVRKIIQDHLPKYLDSSASEFLAGCIESQFPSSKVPELVYMTPANTDYGTNEFLQGMILDEIPFPLLEHLDEGEEDNVPVIYATGIIITPSCHNDAGNHAIVDNSILLARIIEVESYIQSLLEGGISRSRIDSWKDSLMNNRITSCMYLPAYKTNFMEIEESFIQFDYTTRIPLSILSKDKMVSPIFEGGLRIANLQLYGFYLFLIKHSYFMFRFSENLNRFETIENVPTPPQP